MALLIYTLTTLGYSLKFKTLQTVDVIVLAGLYTIRVIAGSAAAHIWPSFWLLSFSMFLFFSLAIVKRVSELLNTQDRGLDKIKGRGYYVSDLSVLQSIGSASGMLAVLVLALYINSQDVLALYKHPEWLWLLCPVLAYWIMRVWMLTARQEMNEDPITFAIRDRNSWVAAVICATVIILGTFI